MGFDGRRDFGELTCLVHPSTYFDLTDTLNLELGGTFFTVAAATSQRYLYGVDVTLRHQPGTSEFYQGLVLGSEWLWNNEKFQRRSTTPARAIRSPATSASTATAATPTSRPSSAAATRSASASTTPRIPSATTNRQRTYSAFATWMPVRVPAPALPVRSDRPGARTERPALHASVDRLPRESQPWLRDALNRSSAALCACLLALSAGAAGATLRVVASMPDVADMTRQIGGERVIGRDDRARAARTRTRSRSSRAS